MTIETKKNSSSFVTKEWNVTGQKEVSYSVQIITNIFNVNNKSLIKNYSTDFKKVIRRIIFVDGNFYNLYSKTILNYFEKNKISHKIISLPIEESTKNIDYLNVILKHVDDFGLSRRDEPIIVIGGGVLTDIVGFAASIYRRGVPYIKVATTLLCAIDSCVGIKTSINHFGRRSRLGTYFGPLISYIDLSLIKSLPNDEVSSALGEIIKIALIKNKKLFNNIYESSNKLLDTNFYKTNIGSKIINESIFDMLEELHENFEEKILKRCVDFGHTFSPVIEMRSLEDDSVSSLKHGEAVCLDVLMSSCISFNRRLLTKQELNKIFAISKKINMPINHPYIQNVDYLMESLLDATKHRGGSQNLPLPIKIGNYEFFNDIRLADVENGIKTYKKLSN